MKTDSSISPRHGLSKSRIAAFEQCPKRLWLQVHRRDLAAIDASKELRFAAGHEVGEVACSLLPHGVMIDAEPDLEAAVDRTAQLLADPARRPLFEATFIHDGVLVRLDIMEPYDDGTWHVAEVKSATSRKDCYVPDLATQLWVLRHNGVLVRTASIRHLDNQFVLTDDGNYAGLFLDVPSLDDAEEWIVDRQSIVAAARDVLAGPEPELSIGDHCNTPYGCEFTSYCNACIEQPTWPISFLPNTGRKLAAKWAEHGIHELTAIPAGGLINPMHQRIQQATIEGVPYHDRDGAIAATAAWKFPRSYLDFETIAFAVPRWIGTSPWQQVPFQFSLHVEDKDGAIGHSDFLLTGGDDPRRACAEALISEIPAEGAIIAYNAGFEKGRIRQLAQHCPDLADALEQIVGRIVDLLPVARNHWYHPDQRGSWSIKAVLPSIGGGDGYSALEVSDGMAAQSAFLATLHASCSPEDKDRIDQNLKAYCRLDTQAMIDVLHHLTGRGAPCRA